jgi:hypothetical protein
MSPGGDGTESSYNDTVLQAPQESQGSEHTVTEHCTDIETSNGGNPIDTASKGETDNRNDPNDSKIGGPTSHTRGPTSDLLNCGGITTEFLLVYVDEDRITWEPTNFLGMTSRDLKRALPSDWWGSILRSSHDYIRIRVATQTECIVAEELHVDCFEGCYIRTLGDVQGLIKRRVIEAKHRTQVGVELRLIVTLDPGAV